MRRPPPVAVQRLEERREERRGSHYVHERTDVGKGPYATVKSRPSLLRSRSDLLYQRVLLLATAHTTRLGIPFYVGKADHINEGGHQHRKLGGDQRSGTNDDELV